MNFKNKYLLATLRILFGAFMLFSGISGLVMGPDAAGVPEALVPINHALWDSGIFQMIKVTEAAGGLMLVFNLLPALAAIFLAPIAVGVVIFNARLAPAFLPFGLILVVFETYLGYAYWDQYKYLFRKQAKKHSR